MLGYFHALMQNPDDLYYPTVLAIKYQVLVFEDRSVSLFYFRADSTQFWVPAQLNET